MSSGKSVTELWSSLFNFRVLLRKDGKYGVYVAHCVETGSVVTAETEEDAKTMMRELLEDEISFALRHGNLKNLFSSPAPMAVLLQWMEAARDKAPTTVELDINVNELEHSEIETKRAHFKNNVGFALAA